MADFVNDVIHGDCLEEMKQIEDGSVDMILCDLPYGTTACKWDSMIPFEPLWDHYKRVIKKKGSIVLTASQPFTTALISSNMDWFKYCWVWNKCFAGNFVLANKRPMKTHEDVIVFCQKQSQYYPQMTKRSKPIKKGGHKLTAAIPISQSKKDFEFGKMEKTYDLKHPTSQITFSCREGRGLHPTQKPVKLFEYLIKTYTSEGETVLDNCAGSGTTGIACMNTNRNFILIEKEEKYIEVINKRLKENQGLRPFLGDEK